METASLCRSTITKVVKHFPTSCENGLCFLRMPSAANYNKGLQIDGLSLKKQRFGDVVAVGCMANSESEMKPAEEEEEWMRVAGRVGGRCRERKGMVQVLECLETEAIMGEDQGRDPTDYNRRAQIFDKSSRVFQALKARTATKPISLSQQT